MNYSKKDYSAYVDSKAPSSKILKNCMFAFFIGGIICAIGQMFSDLYIKAFRLDKELAKTAVSVTMIFLGALLTGLNLYNKIAKYAGAGTLVPITGFANAIVSPAIEFKREGFVLGVAAKMFTIAGPVLVYGITSSAIYGLVYWFLKIFGMGA